MELLLQQLFGINASQDVTSLTIQKSDLLRLVPSGSNSAESLLASLLSLATIPFHGYLTDSQGIELTDSQGNWIEYDNSYDYELDILLWKPNLTVQGFITTDFELTFYTLSPVAEDMQIKDYPQKLTLDPNDLILIQDSVDGTYKYILASLLLSSSNSGSNNGSTGTSSGSTANGGFSALFAATNSDNKITDNNGNIFSTSGNPVINSNQKRGVFPTLYLDGSSYLYIPTATAPQFADHAFCMQGWIYLLDNPANANSMVIMGNALGGGTGNAGLFLCVNQGKLTLRHWINDNSSATSLTNVPQNQWVHFVGNRKGTAIDVYLNGVKGNTGIIEATNTDGQFNIGSVPTGAPYVTNLHGYLQGITVSIGSDIYENNFTPPS